MSEFYVNEKELNKQRYIELLTIVGSLSNLFSDSSNPYLYYRAMENIFCKSFEANNLSRGDVSIDASKDSLGIGLKTFLHSNGNTFQKIAEFNKQSHIIRGLDYKEIVHKIAEMRNSRLSSTKNICGVSKVIYHIVTRKENSMHIFEEYMDEIKIEDIRNIIKNRNTIHFTDGVNEYNFSLSKNTLMKRFCTKEKARIKYFDVQILEDPFNFLLSRKEIVDDAVKQKIFEIDYIILPLYSPKVNEVQKKSGLNMWNADGRKRHYYEVYIPVPKLIHTKCPQFFDSIYKTKNKNNREYHKTKSFNVKLPNQKLLSMKVTQDGGKALQSNPNKDLGNWLIKDIFQIKKGEIITKEKLDNIGIDSVKLSKMSDESYELDFLSTGSYEKFLKNLES